MDITWYGYTCFRIRELGLTILTDPNERAADEPLPRVRTDVITSSLAIGQTARPRGIRGSPLVLESPGEYEVGGIFITAVLASSNKTLFFYDLNGITVCHVGYASTLCDQALVERFEPVDILLFSVDLVNKSNLTQVVHAIEQIGPRIIIPVCTEDTPSQTPNILSLLVDALGLDMPVPVDMFKIRRTHLPEIPLVLLEKQ